MYSGCFGFEEAPFGVTADPGFFHATPLCQEVLSSIGRVIESGGGFVIVTGDTGTGKTTLLRRLICGFGGALDYSFNAAANPRLDFRALLRQALIDLGAPYSGGDEQSLLHQLASRAREQFDAGHSVALLVDEAQGLSSETLSELGCLYSTDGDKLLSIVLTGQTELQKRLESPQLHQIKPLITLHRHLSPLKDEEIEPYLSSRLQQARYRGEKLFDTTAIDRIIGWSGGIPRLINNLCDNALLRAYCASKNRVTGEMIDEVAVQLGLLERSRRVKSTKMESPEGLVARSPVSKSTIEHRDGSFAAIDKPGFDRLAEVEFARLRSSDQPASLEMIPGYDPLEPDTGRSNRAVARPGNCESAFMAESREAAIGPGERAPEDQGPPASHFSDTLDDHPSLIVREDGETERDPGKDSDPERSAAGNASVEEAGEVKVPPASKWIRLDGRGRSNRPCISMGATTLLAVAAGSFIAYYANQRERTVQGEGIKGETGWVAVRAAVVDAEPPGKKRGHESANDLKLKPLSVSPSSPAALAQRSEPKNAGSDERTSVRATEHRKSTQAPPLPIYKVTGPSFLRNKPTADAEIIATLQPGTRVAVTSESREYFQVRALGDDKVSGFVHREDAFFNRAEN